MAEEQEIDDTTDENLFFPQEVWNNILCFLDKNGRNSTLSFSRVSHKTRSIADAFWSCTPSREEEVADAFWSCTPSREEEVADAFWSCTPSEEDSEIMQFFRGKNIPSRFIYYALKNKEFVTLKRIQNCLTNNAASIEFTKIAVESCCTGHVFSLIILYLLGKSLTEQYPSAQSLALDHATQSKLFNQPTPLHAAIKCCQEHCVRFLLTIIADITLRDAINWSALHYAVKINPCNEQHQGILASLCQHKGVSIINQQNNDNETPLHVCCRYGDFSLLSAFLAFHPNLLLVNDKNENALHIACQARVTPDVPQLLIEHKPELLEMQDITGKKPLEHVENPELRTTLERFSEQRLKTTAASSPSLSNC